MKKISDIEKHDFDVNQGPIPQGYEEDDLKQLIIDNIKEIRAREEGTFDFLGDEIDTKVLDRAQEKVLKDIFNITNEEIEKC